MLYTGGAGYMLALSSGRDVLLWPLECPVVCGIDPDMPVASSTSGGDAHLPILAELPGGAILLTWVDEAVPGESYALSEALDPVGLSNQQLLGDDVWNFFASEAETDEIYHDLRAATIVDGSDVFILFASLLGPPSGPDRVLVSGIRYSLDCALP